jgi:tetraacyldisaccharide 4'-kinase
LSATTVSRLWFGRGALAAAARIGLWPASALFRAGVGARNALYDARMLAVHPGAIPAIAVGNLTVGGTGKTPISAWIATELARRGLAPAIVLRGYGGDEPDVHAQLNPGMPVVVDRDRAGGLERARSLGATIAVLDDAFQHRGVTRLADVVLVAAERGLDAWRMLPAGPFREPPSALRRAALVVVTRKTASAAAAAQVLESARQIAGAPGAVVQLAPAGLRSLGTDRSLPVSAVGRRRVVLITGVGEPDLLAGQLRGIGAQVALLAFPDHHAFSDADVARAAAESADADTMVVCTLKDAVKISPRWPGPGTLWYVSQRVTVDQGMEHLERLLDAAAAATRSNPPTAG